MIGEEHAELVVVSGAHPGALTMVHALPCPVRVGGFPISFYLYPERVRFPSRSALIALWWRRYAAVWLVTAWIMTGRAGSRSCLPGLPPSRACCAACARS